MPDQPEKLKTTLAPWDNARVWDGPKKCRPICGAIIDPTIALVTMTKNGIKKLPRLFESVLGFVDCAVVLDTGSSDGTQDWLWNQSFLPCTVYNSPFVNFEVSRNQLMEVAQGAADWLLLLDDDMTLKFLKSQAEVREQLSNLEEAYLLKHSGNMSHWVTRLVRGNRLWKFEGVTHEFIVGADAENGPRFDGVEVEHYHAYGPEKFNRDLSMLATDIARDPSNPRTIYYLAATLRDMGKIGSAIRFFCMRANMGGWEQERWHASYEAARLAEDASAMAKVYQARPTRAEPAAWLALFYKNCGMPIESRYWEDTRAKISMTTDALFVIQSAYGPKLKGL